MRKSVHIALREATLEGDLAIASDSIGLVLFVHGSGSSRHSSRNRYVADELGAHRIATLLFDLLTSDEEVIDNRTRELRFDIELLARRTVGAIEWVRGQPFGATIRIGLFGASTGAAAALIAASRLPDEVSAVVSRGGRPDLAAGSLAKVTAPTLLIVGGNDDVVIELNEEAYRQLRSPKRMEIIPNATHLFEEPGTLEDVAKIAAEFFVSSFTGDREA
jgi:pimeloyl-ACP methyl ester carboxylesterase